MAVVTEIRHFLMPFLVYSELARFNPDNSSFLVTEAESKVVTSYWWWEAAEGNKDIIHLWVIMDLGKEGWLGLIRVEATNQPHLVDLLGENFKSPYALDVASYRLSLIKLCYGAKMLHADSITSIGPKWPPAVAQYLHRDDRGYSLPKLILRRMSIEL